MRRGIAWFTVVASLTASRMTSAQPADEQLECVEAYERTQEARRAGNLLSARALTEMCIVDACHEVIRESCTTWRAELQGDIPTISIRVIDENGNPLGGAQVIVDGQEPLSSAGRTIELDPGTHSIRASASGYTTQEKTFSLAAGQREFLVELSLVKNEISPPPPPAPSPRTLPLYPAFISGGVGVVGFAMLGVFGSRARSADRALDPCSKTRTCDAEEVDDIKLDYTLANVGLGVGIAGAVGAVGWSILVARSRSHREVSVVLTPSGIIATRRF